MKRKFKCSEKVRKSARASQIQYRKRLDLYCGKLGLHHVHVMMEADLLNQANAIQQHLGVSRRVILTAALSLGIKHLTPSLVEKEKARLGPLAESPFVKKKKQIGWKGLVKYLESHKFYEHGTGEPCQEFIRFSHQS